jgi:hypothetical protein
MSLTIVNMNNHHIYLYVALYMFEHSAIYFTEIIIIMNFVYTTLITLF